MELKDILIAMGEFGMMKSPKSTFKDGNELKPISKNDPEHYHSEFTLEDLLYKGMYPEDPSDPLSPVVMLKSNSYKGRT